MVVWLSQRPKFARVFRVVDHDHSVGEREQQSEVLDREPNRDEEKSPRWPLLPSEFSIVPWYRWLFLHAWHLVRSASTPRFSTDISLLCTLLPFRFTRVVRLRAVPARKRSDSAGKRMRE